MSVGRLPYKGACCTPQKHSTSSSQFQAESKLYATVRTVHPHADSRRLTLPLVSSWWHVVKTREHFTI
jgi:hypothetical protein